MLLEMALPRVCLVEGCYTAASPIISKFVFPQNKEICSKWVDFTGNLALLDYWEERQLMGKHLGTHCRICALHFRQEDFFDICKIQLKRGVVPSLNGPLTTEGRPEIATDSYSTPIPSLSSSCSDELSQDTFCANEVGDIELAVLDDPCLPINSLKSLNSLNKNEIKTHLDGDAMRSACVLTPCFSKRVCLVEGCYSTNKTKGVRFFCFPTKKQICSKWVEFTGSLKLLDAWEKGVSLPMNSRICSHHFCDEDYESDWKFSFLMMGRRKKTTFSYRKHGAPEVSEDVCGDTGQEGDLEKANPSKIRKEDTETEVVMDHPGLSGLTAVSQKKGDLREENPSVSKDLCADKEEMSLDNSKDFETAESSIQSDEEEEVPLASSIGSKGIVWSYTKPMKNEIRFIADLGLQVPNPGNTAIDFFNLLATDIFFNLIINYTNLYASQLLRSCTTPKARFKQWKELTIIEFKRFLWLLFHMGTIKCTRLADYWKRGCLFHLRCFSRFMSRDRFMLILRALHLCKYPEEGEPAPQDRLYKIRPLLNFFNETMEKVYYPEKRSSIHESMVLWRGRLFLKQYIKGKQHKYGVKLYMMTLPNGLVQSCTIYSGARDDDIGGANHSEKVVKRLMGNKLNKEHSLFMDNFYNSISVAKFLLENKTYATGTLRANRKGNPCEITSKKIKRGECVEMVMEDGICMLKWKDRRDVIMISNVLTGK